VAARSKARNVFARANISIVGSKPNPSKEEDDDEEKEKDDDDL
jgi:hypothetical protein